MRVGISVRPLLLGLADELADLFLVYQQFPGAQRRVVVDIAVLVVSDVAVKQPQLTIFNQPIGIFQVDQATVRTDLTSVPFKATPVSNFSSKK